ncbi:hypothetical protein MARA_42590 [Mycolicibacterium arabiense]|uniref:Lipoprotein n=1 Tax=Mycolicibacterium arabiense TaxID=1286181 RepID=A0A7I7S306_9MYCO|nr:hypothetical protein [Mycolicibacterium arabiense]MCV7375048.1 hypothetical protein [Mycolicibacterium arabiense]BBY50791.1 hypothetical protein MARA_42590 [Mycolicibacterium arabiense]
MRGLHPGPALTALAIVVALSGCGGPIDAQESSESETTTAAEATPGRDDGVDKYPLGEGPHTVESDPGWVFFRVGAGQGCGIGPIGRVVGCDIVPRDAPPGTNQTAIEGNQPAAYVRSASPSFTRDVAVLPEGHRLTNGATRCAVKAGPTVHCETANDAHGFLISPATGTLW